MLQNLRANSEVILSQLEANGLNIHDYDPPASEASRELANLTERKNLHTPVYGVKEFVCLSVVIKLLLYLLPIK